jgi:hypothetical protein
MEDATKISATHRMQLLAGMKTVLVAGFAAGTLDALGAIVVYGPVLGKLSIGRIFRGIASAAYGHLATQGGMEMAWIGLGFHYLIAVIFAGLYCLIFPNFRFLHHRALVSGFLYGMIIWLVMNLLVLPRTKLPPAPFSLSGIILSALLLIFLVGLPIALITQRYWNRRLSTNPFSIF